VSERRAALVIPEDAIVQRADGAVIFKVDASQRVQRINVETGVVRDGWIEIRSGLTQSDLIVVRGQTRIDDGVVVSIREADGRPVSASSVAAGARALAAGSEP
jgi:hypothetical protein